MKPAIRTVALRTPARPARVNFLPLTAAVGALLLLLAAPAAKAHDTANSTTILGTTNLLLSQGAEQLQTGHVEEGLRLTLEGLKEPGDLHDIAAGHANACAAYALLMKWDEALDQCNQALAMDSGNWRAFNNRAAIYVEKGLFDLAFQDINSGLEIAPNSRTLHESRRVAERNKRIMERRGRRAVPS